MSNTHEYVIFDRAKIDPVLAMKWSALDKKYRGWGQWPSAKEFLADWALDDSNIDKVDQIIARKTIRATLLLNEDRFSILWGILDAKSLAAATVDIDKGDYDYADDIVSCAGAAFIRSDISFASLTAVHALHASHIDIRKVLPPKLAKRLLQQPAPPPMLPGIPNLMSSGGDAIGILQARKVIAFLIQAWREDWPLQSDPKKGPGKTIRSCVAAGRLNAILRRRHLHKPCIFRWFEC